MNQNPLNSSGFFLDNYSNGLQPQTDATQTNNQAHYNNLDSSYNYIDPLSMFNNSNNSISPVNNALNTVNSTSQYFSNLPQYDDCDTNGLPYSVNPQNATFNSFPPQIIHKIEIPGFEIEMI